MSSARDWLSRHLATLPRTGRRERDVPERLQEIAGPGGLIMWSTPEGLNACERPWLEETASGLVVVHHASYAEFMALDWSHDGFEEDVGPPRPASYSSLDVDGVAGLRFDGWDLRKGARP